MTEETYQKVELIPEAVKQFFLDSVSEKEQTIAEIALLNIDITSQSLLKHHLEFELDRLNTQDSEDFAQEEGRLAIIYANCNSFGLLKKDFIKAKKQLRELNTNTAEQVILHIENNTDIILQEMILKKTLEMANSHPLRPRTGKNHIH